MIEALNHGMVSIAVVGTVFNLGGGLIEADGGKRLIRQPSLTNAANATIEALDGGILSFTAATTAFHNAGTMSLDDGTLARSNSNITLDGGGVVTLSDDSRNAIDSFGAAGRSPTSTTRFPAPAPSATRT